VEISEEKVKTNAASPFLAPPEISSTTSQIVELLCLGKLVREDMGKARTQNTSCFRRGLRLRPYWTARQAALTLSAGPEYMGRVKSYLKCRQCESTPIILRLLYFTYTPQFVSVPSNCINVSTPVHTTDNISSFVLSHSKMFGSST
jgi:hypothetical protein